MTKGSQIDPGSKCVRGNNFSSGNRRIPLINTSYTVFDPNLDACSDKKGPDRYKRKTTITASKNIPSGNKTKKFKASSNNNDNPTADNQPVSNIPKVEKTVKINSTSLAPLLHRSCPGNFLPVDSFKGHRQELSKENNVGFRFTALNIPVSHRQKAQIFEKQKKSLRLPERNRSAPNLRGPSLCEKATRFEALLPSSQTLATDFPDVVQFYEKAFLQKFNKLYPCLRSANTKRVWNWNLNPTLSALKKPCTTFSTHPKIPTNSVSPPSSQSVPNTLRSLLSIRKARKCRNHPPLGGVASCNSFMVQTKTELKSSSPGVCEDFTQIQPEITSIATHKEEENSKRLSSDTVVLYVSDENTMNSKSNHQISANQKSAQALMQYHMGRTRPRVASNFSSSFVLPYGLGGRIQSSPTSTPAIPNSSSFHAGPLESLQLLSENHRSITRQQSQCSSGQRQQRKYLERQKMQMLKPLGVNKSQNSIAKFYEIPTSEFSSAILPDTGTGTYRFNHDVSFDEGSRYRTSEFAHGLKGKDDSRNQNVNGLTHHFGAAVSMRGTEPGAASQIKHEGRGREHEQSSSNNYNNIGFKDAVPLSLIRMEERSGLPSATSPSSPALSSAIAASTSSFIPPPSASRPSPPAGTSSAGGNITFRFHKEKQNWDYRLGEISVNGGGYGYSNATTANTAFKQDFDALNPMNMASAIQRNLHTRERTMSTMPKSRLSSRYSSKVDAANGAAATYSDPCISAPPSFQQRLLDLSILESETTRYEKNRKLRRKKNQDKDL